MCGRVCITIRATAKIKGVLIIACGANVNCLDEFGASALGYLAKLSFIEDFHGNIIVLLRNLVKKS